MNVDENHNVSVCGTPHTIPPLHFPPGVEASMVSQWVLEVLERKAIFAQNKDIGQILSDAWSIFACKNDEEEVFAAEYIKKRTWETLKEEFMYTSDLCAKIQARKKPQQKKASCAGLCVKMKDSATQTQVLQFKKTLKKQDDCIKLGFSEKKQGSSIRSKNNSTQVDVSEFEITLKRPSVTSIGIQCGKNYTVARCQNSDMSEAATQTTRTIASKWTQTVIRRIHQGVQTSVPLKKDYETQTAIQSFTNVGTQTLLQYFQNAETQTLMQRNKTASTQTKKSTCQFDSETCTEKGDLMNKDTKTDTESIDKKAGKALVRTETIKVEHKNTSTLKSSAKKRDQIKATGKTTDRTKSKVLKTFHGYPLLKGEDVKPRTIPLEPLADYDCIDVRVSPDYVTQKCLPAFFQYENEHKSVFVTSHSPFVNDLSTTLPFTPETELRTTFEEMVEPPPTSTTCIEPHPLTFTGLIVTPSNSPSMLPLVFAEKTEQPSYVPTASVAKFTSSPESLWNISESSIEAQLQGTPVSSVASTEEKAEQTELFPNLELHDTFMGNQNFSDMLHYHQNSNDSHLSTVSMEISNEGEDGKFQVGFN